MKRAKDKIGQSEIERRRTCIHEAGHVVMRWHLGMTPTRVEIYDTPHGQTLGMTHGDGKKYEHSIFMAYSAGGYAAELRQERASRLARFLRYSNWFEAFNKTPEKYKGTDREVLAQGAIPGGIHSIQFADDVANDKKAALLNQLKAALLNQFAEALENAYEIVSGNWEKVQRVAELLKQDGAIGQRDMAIMFAEWGDAKGGDK